MRHDELKLAESHMEKDCEEMPDISGLHQLLKEADENIVCGERVCGLKRHKRFFPARDAFVVA